LRAYHQVADGTPKVLDDPISPRLVDREALERYAIERQIDAPHMTELRLHVLARSRYAEERLADAVARGLRSYVSLGAGFDTFAYRQPPWARELRIFEVDHPASQSAKRERLAAAGIALPENLTFAPIDFERDTLAAGLAAAGFAAAEPTFFSWLGAMMYLNLAAIDAVLGYVGSRPLTSELVFSFARPERESDAGRREISQRVAAGGEPWLTHFEPAELETKLRGAGFSQVEFLSAADVNARYRPTASGLRPMRLSSIGSATV
jgi:methyltransferase (TIGR00027 family)